MAPPEQVTDTAREQAGATAGTVKQQTTEVAQTAAQAASDVGSTAKEQAANVVGEAVDQARNLGGELRGQVSEQAETQSKRLADAVRSIGQELQSLANGEAQSGPATDMVRQVADRAHRLAGRLDERGPQGLLEDLRSFARQRPGGFLLGAALAGAATGRLVKGATATGSDESEEWASTGAWAQPDAGAGLGTAAGMPIVGLEPESGLVTDTAYGMDDIDDGRYRMAEVDDAFDAGATRPPVVPPAPSRDLGGL